MSGWDAPHSLPWLPSAERHVALWDEVGEQLTLALGDLDERTVVVVQVGTLSSADRTWLPGRFLQFTIDLATGDRTMVAEASGAKHELAAVAKPQTVSDEFTRLGWPMNPDLHTYSRRFEWPEQIGTAVMQSLEIIRGLWRTPAPGGVQIAKRRLAGPAGGESDAGESTREASMDSADPLSPLEAHPEAELYYPTSRHDALIQIAQWVTTAPNVKVQVALDDEGLTEALLITLDGQTVSLLGHLELPEVRLVVPIGADPELTASLTPEFLRDLYDSGAGTGAIWVSGEYVNVGMTLAVTSMARSGVLHQINALLRAAGEIEQLAREG